MEQHLEDRAMNVIDRPVRRTPQAIPWPRRVRASFGGETVADSEGVLLLLEPGRLPVYYFPPEDVRRDLLMPSETRSRTPSKGDAAHWHLRVGDREATDAAWSYAEPREPANIAGAIAFHWRAMDAWFEEDDEVFVHPKDPYHRIDILNSSRRVRVEVEGILLAESGRPRLLFETGIPTRYYLPKMDVRLDLLEPSGTVTSCPYKGTTVHFNARVGDHVVEDVAWVYATPLTESSKIENLIAFYNERVDLSVDGQLQPRPKTPWSR